MSLSSDEEEANYVDMAAEHGTRSRFHNFSFPTLSWGAHRLYRCSKKSASDGGKFPTSTPRKPVGKHRSPLLPARGRKHSVETVEEAVITTARPWNLRTRRAACNAPRPPTPPHAVAENRQKNSSSSSQSPSPSPLTGRSAAMKSVRRRSQSSEKEEKGERTKLSVALSKEEIEEDFLLFKGSKPPRRPKKRPRVVQRQLDSLFPGLWLTEVMPENYKLQEDL